MRTLLGTPEVTTKYGVIWTPDPEAPFCEYDDLVEAAAVAKAAGGRVMVKQLDGWVPL